MKRFEIVILDNELEYRDLYRDTFLSGTIHFFGIPVSFHESDFDHIFFEPSAGGEYVFSVRRAKRMLFIADILAGSVVAELGYQEDRDTFALFSRELECAVYLRRRPGSGSLQVGTFFDFGKDHEKMYRKQKKKCVNITLPEIRGML
jgi:hypothetical protein